MEDKTSIKKKYIDKIKKLKKHNELYYSKSKPVVSDKDYDELKLSIINLENKYTYLNHED